MQLTILLIPIISFGLSAWLAWRFCSASSRFHILDHPNDRSLHQRPTPRSGGVAIAVALALGMMFVVIAGYPVPGLAWLVASMTLVSVVSYLDDRFRVPASARLLAHALAAGMLIVGGYSFNSFIFPYLEWITPFWLGAGLAFLFIVWMTNLYNFMDGMDGLAGGMAVMGFGAFSILGWKAEDETFFMVNLIVAASAAGFLVFNFPPARIFMGDVGSVLLGLLAGAFSAWGTQASLFPFWIALLIFSPFIVDATVTLLRRMFQGEKVWQAHKSHYYQRLAQSEWGHRKTVLVEYAIMLGCGVTSIMVLRATALVQTMALIAWALFYAGFFFWVAQHERRSR